MPRWHVPRSWWFFFFFNDTATTEIYTLSLHDALPISTRPSVASLNAASVCGIPLTCAKPRVRSDDPLRSEEHTSELQSHSDLVCRLLLEKKKKQKNIQEIEQKKKNKHQNQ